MTKKDYQATARAFYEINNKLRADWTGTQVVEFLGAIFKADNDNFDYTRFIQACNTGKCKGMKGAVK